MKALLLEEAGRWKEMVVGEAAKPQAETGEIVVQVQAVGLNPVDYQTGKHGNPHWHYPHILGLDVAGFIEEVGIGVTDWKPGDRVVYHGDLRKPGGYAEFAVTAAHTVSRIPDFVTFEEAAALPCAGYTAFQALYRKLHVQPGESILIHAGAGGVGGFAIQLAKRSGCIVLTTCSPNNANYVRSLGADLVIDYQSENLKDKVMEFTSGQGVQAVLDTVGRVSATDSLALLSFNGGIAHIAGAPDYSQVKPFTRALSYHEVALGAAHSSNDRRAQKDLAVMGDTMLQLLECRQLNPMINRTVTLEEVPNALEELALRHVRGKIVAVL